MTLKEKKRKEEKKEIITTFIIYDRHFARESEKCKSYYQKLPDYYRRKEICYPDTGRED